MSAPRFAAFAMMLAGCSVDVGAPGAWTPVEDAVAPLVVESNLTASPSPFRAKPGVAPTSIRVVTYNVDLEVATLDPSALIDTIQGDPELSQGSVFLFQEAEAYPGEPASRIKTIADHLGLGYVYVPARISGSDDHTHGLAILSAYPMQNIVKKNLPLALSSQSQKIAVAADIVVGDRMLHVIDVYLNLETSTAQRIAQLRPAVIDAPTETLIAGDFNMSWVQWVPPGVPVLSGTSATNQADAVDSYMHALAFDAPSAGSGPTAHAYGIDARVDAVFSRGLDVTFGSVVHDGPSDHWPMWVDVELP